MKLARLLDAIGVTEAALRLRRATPVRSLTVLMYHRVASSAGGLFDEGVVDATPEEFDRQLALMKRYFSIVGGDEVIAYARGGRLPSNPALITFDDGYLDNHDQALPILLRHGLRATFFIATSYISERRLFWWDRISHAVKSSPRDRICLEYPTRQEIPLGADRGLAISLLMRIVKDRYALDLPRFLDHVTEVCGVHWSAEVERGYADRLLMTWDHVRALRRAGMDVQSHTRTHRVLQTLPVAALDSELAGSRADLERELGEPVRMISYPVAKSIARAPAIRAAVRAAGYEVGFSGARVPRPFSAFDALDLRRINVERDLPLSYFRGILAIRALAHKSRDAS